MKNDNSKNIKCPFGVAIESINGKWKGHILWHLSKHEVLRYGEVRKLLGKITQKMLTQSLRELESSKLVNRKVYPVVPPKVEYTLTEHGKSLIPILLQLYHWGEGLSKELGIVFQKEIS
jgi:DNA-binding HxlR family transcriptional regulator